MKKLSVALAAAFLLGSVSTVAMADDATNGGATNTVSDQHISTNNPSQFSVDNIYVDLNMLGVGRGNKGGYGWNVGSGYNFTDHLAAEVAYNGFPSKPFSIFGGGGHYLFDVAGKYTSSPLETYFPNFTPGFRVFGKAGLGYEHDGDSKNSDGSSASGIGMLLGVGTSYAIPASWHMGQNWSLLGEFNLLPPLNNDFHTMFLFNVGISHRF